ncbi:ferredoxin [Candidatus Woesearchaeota archaeon]|nr:ferredoxin [Candidatus Woesearchaeota archaeon]
MVKIIHFRDKCIGCNSCVEQAPSQWSINVEDGKSDLSNAKKKKECFVTEISDVELEENERAAKDCPMKCIKIQ